MRFLAEVALVVIVLVFILPIVWKAGNKLWRAMNSDE